MKHSFQHLVLFLGAVVLSTLGGCKLTGVLAPDGNTPHHDAGAPDADTDFDAGSEPDASTNPSDAGMNPNPTDAGPTADAGTTHDAGGPIDAGPNDPPSAPGPFADFDNDGQFDPGDILIADLMGPSGYFSTTLDNGPYHPPRNGAPVGIVFPSGSSLDHEYGVSLEFHATGHIRLFGDVQLGREHTSVSLRACRDKFSYCEGNGQILIAPDAHIDLGGWRSTIRAAAGIQIGAGARIDATSPDDAWLAMLTEGRVDIGSQSIVFSKYVAEIWGLQGVYADDILIDATHQFLNADLLLLGINEAGPVIVTNSFLDGTGGHGEVVIGRRTENLHLIDVHGSRLKAADAIELWADTIDIRNTTMNRPDELFIEGDTILR